MPFDFSGGLKCIKLWRLCRGGGAGQADQATARPMFTKTSINYYLRMEICASLAILPDQCLTCLTKVQLLPPPLLCTRRGLPQAPQISWIFTVYYCDMSSYELGRCMGISLFFFYVVITARMHKR